MFTCLLGERNSGKSVFAEEKIKNEDEQALYIATLPELEMYREMIGRHQKRRPSSWKCIELFKMSMDEILAYPYQNYRNIILDNLSYYLLFQLYYNKDGFWQKCDERVFSLIDRLASDSGTMVYVIDTPIGQELSGEEGRAVCRIFTDILDKSVSIQRFFYKDKVIGMTAEEGKAYLLCT